MRKVKNEPGTARRTNINWGRSGLHIREALDQSIGREQARLDLRKHALWMREGQFVAARSTSKHLHLALNDLQWLVKYVARYWLPSSILVVREELAYLSTELSLRRKLAYAAPLVGEPVGSKYYIINQYTRNFYCVT